MPLQGMDEERGEGEEREGREGEGSIYRIVQRDFFLASGIMRFSGVIEKAFWSGSSLKK